MTDEARIAANLARLRLDRELTQGELAAKAGLSRGTVGKIERAAVLPHAGTLRALARALEVRVADLVTVVRQLENVRFRARAKVHARGQILAEVADWLAAYDELEACLDRRLPFRFGTSWDPAQPHTPTEAAQRARRTVGLGPSDPIRDICGLLEDNGVKLLLLDKPRDSFFGLSVGCGGGGPAVIVNSWDRISVERWIFTAAHELGHLLLHASEYAPDVARASQDAEREADTFASEFLMPERAFVPEWRATRGQPLIVRVLKVKRMFKVSYKTVLFRLVASGRAPRSIWLTFQRQHKARFGKTLRKADEPEALDRTEFAWDWRRSGEPASVSRHEFVDDRLSRLVRQAVERHLVSLARAAEVLNVSHLEMRELARDWIISSDGSKLINKKEDMQDERRDPTCRC